MFAAEWPRAVVTGTCSGPALCEDPYPHPAISGCLSLAHAFWYLSLHVCFYFVGCKDVLEGVLHAQEPEIPQAAQTLCPAALRDWPMHWLAGF